MQEKQTTQTITIYIASDGKEFKRKGECEFYEEKLLKKQCKNGIVNMDHEQLNISIKKFLNKNDKQYSSNLIDAFELAEERNLFDDEEFMLYKNYDKLWCIGHDEYDGNIKEDISAKTIPEVICKFALLKFHELLDI